MSGVLVAVVVMSTVLGAAFDASRLGQPAHHALTISLSAGALLAAVISAMAASAVRRGDARSRHPAAWEVDAERLPGWGARQALLVGLLLDLPRQDWLEDVVWCAQREAECAVRMVWIAPVDDVCTTRLQNIAELGRRADQAVRSYLARGGSTDLSDEHELVAISAALQESLAA